MKKEVVKELEHAFDEAEEFIVNWTNDIDEIDLPFGETQITNIKESINKVITIIKQEIEFDDALKQKKLNTPNNCHIHSWEHDEYDAFCQLCTISHTIEYVEGE